MNTFRSRAEWLSYVRRTHTALTITRMAELFHVTRPAASHWESGRCEVPDYVVHSFARSIPGAPAAPPRKVSAHRETDGAVITFDLCTERAASLFDMIEAFPGTAVPKSILRQWLAGGAR
jgi:hypothetical protein